VGGSFDENRQQQPGMRGERQRDLAETSPVSKLRCTPTCRYEVVRNVELTTLKGDQTRV
jgi:hypothetical protein